MVNVIIIDNEKVKQLSRLLGLQLPMAWKVLDHIQTISEIDRNVKSADEKNPRAGGRSWPSCSCWKGKVKGKKSMVSKEYIEREYHLAVLDFKVAHNADEQWEARKTMARLEQIATQEYGFEYLDRLHRKELGSADKSSVVNLLLEKQKLASASPTAPAEERSRKAEAIIK